jgi:hypothetical protein
LIKEIANKQLIRIEPVVEILKAGLKNVRKVE